MIAGYEVLSEPRFCTPAGCTAEEHALVRTFYMEVSNIVYYI